MAGIFRFSDMERDATSCPRCNNEYDWDYKKLVDEKKTNLRIPCSCRHCGFTLCYPCVEEGQVRRVAEGGRMVDWIYCPESACQKERAIPSAKPFPNIHACLLLKSWHEEIQQQEAAMQQDDDEEDDDDDEESGDEIDVEVGVDSTAGASEG